MRYFILALLAAALAIACGGEPSAPSGALTPTPTAAALAPTPTPPAPVWVEDLIASFDEDRDFRLSEYRYGGRTVFFVEPLCCDRFTDLYDADGGLIAHPSGGIAGGGDGRASDFIGSATLVRVVWPPVQEPRMRVLAQIVSIEVTVAESFPPQYFLHVVSSLPNGCHRPDGWELERESASEIRVSVYNTVPDESSVGSYVCTMQFGTAESTVPLGSGFDPGTAYVVFVNDRETVFTAQ